MSILAHVKQIPAGSANGWTTTYSKVFLLIHYLAEAIKMLTFLSATAIYAIQFIALFQSSILFSLDCYVP